MNIVISPASRRLASLGRDINVPSLTASPNKTHCYSPLRPPRGTLTQGAVFGEAVQGRGSDAHPRLLPTCRAHHSHKSLGHPNSRTRINPKRFLLKDKRKASVIQEAVNCIW
ncbi:hypothetical protein E2C01_003487 [Portunus trituberculatus]|uniref:Uncharacterized protein n=1 Tax=Portunus trituberculatus TaxID=210409 RepID=A0A5B7CTP1_PORTR|nr:hypothetical protein [Portunus trituberculatus]